MTMIVSRARVKSFQSFMSCAPFHEEFMLPTVPDAYLADEL